MSNEVARQSYGTASGKIMATKIIHDNRILFKSLQNYYIAYLDIETYNSNDFTVVP